MNPESTVVTIVLVGKFDPNLFRLEKLVECQALSEADSQASSYVALLPDQVVEIAMPWGKLTALSERVSIEVAQVPFIRGADLALKCMREIAPSSLVRMFGINVTSIYQLPSIDARDALGTRLVPPTSWGAWGVQVKDSLKLGGTKHGGMTLAVLRQGVPDDREGGWLDARVEPSRLFQNTAVQIGMNDHYEVPSVSEGGQTFSEKALSKKLLDRLESAFDLSVERSARVANEIVLGG